MTAERRRARIATVYKRTPVERAQVHAMDTIRWLRTSEGLADLGFSVDVIADTRDGLGPARPNLRHVPLARVDWSQYDVVKVHYHGGLALLLEAGGGDHPFIISRLGSVVGRHDGAPGVHYFGNERQVLWEWQQEVQRRARYVVVPSEPSRALWQAEFAARPPILLVPTGVDREIPAPSRNPYDASGQKVAVYIGNIYQSAQRNVNLLWQQRLNALGERLGARQIRLYFVGPGRTDLLDPRFVTSVGPVSCDEVWDYQRFADVGIVLAQGEVHNNEASKLYYYLRSGLPVVSEAPIPNNHLIEESGCGLIAPYGDDAVLAEMIEAAASRRWDREGAIRYVLANHTWQERCRTYEDLLEAELGS